MVSALLTKYLLVALAAQICLSLINTLFIISGGGGAVALALIGIYGVFQRIPSVLLFFCVVEGISISMDIIRLVLWSPFILNDVLQLPATLGTFFLVLTIFETIVKTVVLIFTIMIRREIVEWLRDPRIRSTLHRANTASLSSALGYAPAFLQPDETTKLLPKKQSVGGRAGDGARETMSILSNAAGNNNKGNKNNNNVDNNDDEGKQQQQQQQQEKQEKQEKDSVQPKSAVKTPKKTEEYHYQSFGGNQ